MTSRIPDLGVVVVLYRFDGGLTRLLNPKFTPENEAAYQHRIYVDGELKSAGPAGNDLLEIVGVICSELEKLKEQDISLLTHEPPEKFRIVKDKKTGKDEQVAVPRYTRRAEWENMKKLMREFPRNGINVCNENFILEN